MIYQIVVILHLPVIDRFPGESLSFFNRFMRHSAAGLFIFNQMCQMLLKQAGPVGRSYKTIDPMLYKGFASSSISYNARKAAGHRLQGYIPNSFRIGREKEKIR